MISSMEIKAYTTKHKKKSNQEKPLEMGTK